MNILLRKGGIIKARILTLLLSCSFVAGGCINEGKARIDAERPIVTSRNYTYFKEQKEQARIEAERPITTSRNYTYFKEQLDEANSWKEFEWLLSESIERWGVDTANSLVVPRRRQWYVDNHPELSPQIRAAILNGKIILGMAKESVRASWGKPNWGNRSVHTFGVHEQWVYDGQYGGSYYRNTYYLNFEDDILTSWQE